MLQEDTTAACILRMHNPSMLRRFSPRCVRGDGNCFYRAVSLGVFGSQQYHTYLRIVTAMEMIANQSLYDGSSDAFVLKNAPIFTPRYRQVLHSALTDGRCAEQIHIFALSAALQLTIQSYCAPGTQNVEGCHPYTMSVSTGTFSAGISYTDLTVMWSNNKYSGGAQPPDPNHFVLLIPIQGSASPRRTAEQRSDCVTVNVSLGDTDTPAGLMPVSQSTPRVDSNTSFRACSTSVNGDEGNLCDANDSVIIVDSSSSDDIGDCRSQTVAL